MKKELSLPSLTTFSAILLAVGLNASTFLTSDLPAPSVAPAKKHKMSRPLFIFILVGLSLSLGGAGAGIGFYYFRNANRNTGDGKASSSLLSFTSTAASTPTSTASSSSGGTSSTSTSSSEQSSSSVPSSSSESSISSNGEPTISFAANPLTPGKDISLLTQNFTQEENAIIPAILFEGQSVYYSVLTPSSLPFATQAKSLKACFYNFLTRTPATTPVSVSVSAAVIPTNLDEEIARCNEDKKTTEDSAMAYQTNEADPAYQALHDLQTLGVQKGYLTRSGNDYVFTETASDSFKKDDLAAQNKSVYTTEFANSLSHRASLLGDDVTYLASLKY